LTMRLAKAALAAVLGATLILPRVHAETRIQSDINYRKDLMLAMDWNLVRIAQMVRHQLPYSRARLMREGSALQALSTLPWVAFVPGSDRGQTKAKPRIWQQPIPFRAAIRHFEAQVQALNVAAQSGNLAQIARPLQGTAESCKSCHHHFMK